MRLEHGLRWLFKWGIIIAPIRSLPVKGSISSGHLTEMYFLFLYGVPDPVKDIPLFHN